MEAENKLAVYTGSIPQCPHCERPTIRTRGMSSSTMVYFPPVYDEQGRNTNPDRNSTTTDYDCSECKNSYRVSSNIDGSYYV